jgi:hypothetical protein
MHTRTTVCVGAQSHGHERVHVHISMCTCSLTYTACKVHALNVTQGLSGSTIFFNIITQAAQFSEKKLLKLKCVFCFSLQLLSKTFLTLTRIQQDIVINVKTSSCKVPVILVRF